jgi:hypothetical protein
MWPGTIREFQFPESTDLHLRVKWHALSAVPKAGMRSMPSE